MNRSRMIVAEAIRSIRASMSTTVAATMTVLVAMLVLGTTIGLGTWLLSYSDHIKKQLVVKVYFSLDATPKQINRIGAKFDPKVNPLVKNIKFVSKAEALKIMKKRTPELFKSGLAYNPLPDAYEIQPKKGEYLDQVRNELKPKPPGVDSINDGGKTSHRVLKVGGIVSVIFLVGVVLLLAASTLLIGNTIRLSIFSRRREIEVMKLVGATNWFVRGPFMVEGLFCGLAGSVAAVILLVIGKSVILPLIGISHSKDAHALAFELNALIIVAIGILLGAFGTGVTLRRFLQV
ncbi:MAG TPA: permease-like cell division protein FtsX [Gaiellaceae bacterium]|nr:permease-like cell division protein FtsX [Gaiellaceae bacterium]